MVLFKEREISLSIVLYNTSSEDIRRILMSLEVINSCYLLYLIDNSPKDSLRSYFEGIQEIKYIHNPSNPGFGSSHNIAIIDSIKEKIPFHFVINPDAYFCSDVITDMVSYMKSDEKIGMVMPEILNTDGTLQYLPKLLPSPFSIFLRRIKWPAKVYARFVEKYELRFVPQERIYQAPILSGCFTLFRVKALQEIGLYDDDYFMYFEDWDISRRMHKLYKTVYYPHSSVFHGYEAASGKSLRMLKIHVRSAIHYFNKWGWFFDLDRNRINRKTLNQFTDIFS